MRALFLVSFIAGLLLAVRLMFFGAERRRVSGRGTPLRRSEPAGVSLLLAFGVAGYLLHAHTSLPRSGVVMGAAVIAAAVAGVVVRLAILTAQLQPAHDPDDPRFVHQGVVAVVTARIPEGGEGAIALPGQGHAHPLRARSVDARAMELGQEVCIERVEDDVALVELWSNVEQRL